MVDLRESANIFMDIEEVSELPICLLVDNLNDHSTNTQETDFHQIQESIKTQNYQNKKIILLHDKKGGEGMTFYQVIESALKRGCHDERALVMMVSKPLAPSALQKVNEIHQKYHTYITYSSDKFKQTIEVISFYRRIF